MGRLNHRRRITAGTANPSAATLDPQRLTPLSFCLARGNSTTKLHRAPGIWTAFASVIEEGKAIAIKYIAWPSPKTKPPLIKINPSTVQIHYCKPEAAVIAATPGMGYIGAG